MRHLVDTVSFPLAGAGVVLSVSSLLGVILVLISCACCRAKKSNVKAANRNGNETVFGKNVNGGVSDSFQEAQADGYHKIIDRGGDLVSQPFTAVSLNHRALPAVPSRQPNSGAVDRVDTADSCLTRESSISELYATVDKSVAPSRGPQLDAFDSTKNYHGYSIIDDYSAAANPVGSGQNVSVLQVNSEITTAEKLVHNHRPSVLFGSGSTPETSQLYAPVTKSGPTGSQKSLTGTTVHIGSQPASEPLYNRIDGEPSISEDPYSSIKGDEDSESDPLYSKVGADNGASSELYGIHRPNQPHHTADNNDQPDLYDPLYCQVDDWPKPAADPCRPSSYVGPPTATSPRTTRMSPNAHVYAKVYRTSSDKQIVSHVVKLPVRCEHEYSVIKKYDTEPNVHYNVPAERNSGYAVADTSFGSSAEVLRLTANPTHSPSPNVDSIGFEQPTTSSTFRTFEMPSANAYESTNGRNVPFDQLNNGAFVTEPSYKFITVRESLESLRARIEQSAAAQVITANVSSRSVNVNGVGGHQSSDQLQHYYSTIQEHNYELVHDRQSHQGSALVDNSSLFYEQLPYDRDPISDLEETGSLQYMDYAAPSQSSKRDLANLTKDRLAATAPVSESPGSSVQLSTRERLSDRHYSGIGQPVPIFRPTCEESDSGANTASRSPSSHETPVNGSSSSEVSPTEKSQIESKRTEPKKTEPNDSGFSPSTESSSSNADSFSSRNRPSSTKARGDGECEEDLDCFCHGKQRHFYL